MMNSFKNKTYTEIGDEGSLLSFTDVHGDLRVFNKCINLWDEDDLDSHICFNGDIIHGRCHPHQDETPDILDRVSEYIDKPNFHCNYGNHELTMIDSNAYLYKEMGIWRKHFELSVRNKKGKKDFHIYLESYRQLLSKFKLYLTTKNGLFLSHAGPSTRDNSYRVSDFLWNYIDEYEIDDVDSFLNKNGYKFMACGHTEIQEGYRFNGNLLVFNTNHHADGDFPCYYLDIDLSSEVNKQTIINSLKKF